VHVSGTDSLHVVRVVTDCDDLLRVARVFVGVVGFAASGSLVLAIGAAGCLFDMAIVGPTLSWLE
jgi:hypothetical protein